MKSSDSEILLMPVGDLYTNREDPKAAFRDILPLFKDKDRLTQGILLGICPDMS